MQLTRVTTKNGGNLKSVDYHNLCTLYKYSYSITCWQYIKINCTLYNAKFSISQLVKDINMHWKWLPVHILTFLTPTVPTPCLFTDICLKTKRFQNWFPSTVNDIKPSLIWTWTWWHNVNLMNNSHCLNPTLWSSWIFKCLKFLK